MISNIALLGAIKLGLIYSFLTIGLMISYRILKISDLTTDGSYAFGGAVSIMFMIAGKPWLGIICGMLAGALAGVLNRNFTY